MISSMTIIQSMTIADQGNSSFAWDKEWAMAIRQGK